jgi:hypothetical protein
VAPLLRHGLIDTDLAPPGVGCATDDSLLRGVLMSTRRVQWLPVAGAILLIRPSRSTKDKTALR